MNFKSLFLLSISLIATTFPCQAGRKNALPYNPDFTDGQTIPEGATHDWNLGATGARGWMYSEKLGTTKARQIAITAVEKGSPAAKQLKVGDIILGVGSENFASDARTVFGKALSAAESEERNGELALIRWRKGEIANVILDLPVLGSYSPTAPYNCPKSAKIFKRGCEALAERMKKSDYRQNPVTRSLNALALLSNGEKKYLPILKKEAEWAAGFKAEGMATWYYGYTISFLAEYSMITRDPSVIGGLERLVKESCEGQSLVGSWGHKFAGEDGRLQGYGMMNAPGVTLTTALVLAREAGVENPLLDQAIERSLKLLRFYNGKGAIPYGDHAPWTQTHDDNGKNGMAAVLFAILGEKEPTRYFSKMSLASHGNERDSGHTGNFWNMTWALPAIAQLGPQATGAWMKEFGGWYFDLARGHENNFHHQGPPSARPDSTRNWDATGAYLLAYSLPLRTLVMTGKKPPVIAALSSDQAEAIVDLGRGWTNIDQLSRYSEMNEEELLQHLRSWSPTVRERAAIALSKKKTKAPIEKLISLLKSDDLNARYGACDAISRLKGRAEKAAPALIEALQAEDLWLRIRAAEALSVIGQPGFEAIPDLLKIIIKGTTSEDPRGMEQRFITMAVFQKMFRQSAFQLNEVNSDLLANAIKSALTNEDGRARGAVAGVYSMMDFEQIEPLFPAILKAVTEPAPSGIMFADVIRLAGIQTLAKHKISDGLPLTTQVLELDRWGKKARVSGVIKVLKIYGDEAKPILPELIELQEFIAKEKNQAGWAKQSKALNQIIEKLKDADPAGQLRSLK